MTARVCECGCGASLDGMRPQARFRAPSHRAAASRARAAQRAPGARTGPQPGEGLSAREKPNVRFVDGLLASAPGPALATKRELAAELRVTERTIERWMVADMPYVRLRSGRPRYDLAACRAWQLRPVESRRLLRAGCAGCGCEGHLEQHLADIASVVCRVCGEPLAVDGGGR